MNKSLSIIPAVVLLFAASTGNAFAAGSVYGAPAGNAYGASGCQPIYGGGDSCVQSGQVTINKLVQNPQTKQYVDNLSSSDPKYTAGQSLSFKIIVSNTSNAKLSNIVLKDVLPEFIEFADGAGNYDKNSKTLTIKIDSLDKNESREFFVSGKVVNAQSLPADQSIMCLVNQATVSMDSKMSQDNSQFCIEKSPANPTTTKGGLKVFPPSAAKTTPDTGAESLALIGLIPSAVAGLALRRKSK